MIRRINIAYLRSLGACLGGLRVFSKHFPKSRYPLGATIQTLFRAANQQELDTEEHAYLGWLHRCLDGERLPPLVYRGDANLQRLIYPGRVIVRGSLRTASEIACDSLCVRGSVRSADDIRTGALTADGPVRAFSIRSKLIKADDVVADTYVVMRIAEVSTIRADVVQVFEQISTRLISAKFFHYGPFIRGTIARLYLRGLRYSTTRFKP